MVLFEHAIKRRGYKEPLKASCSLVRILRHRRDRRDRRSRQLSLSGPHSSSSYNTLTCGLFGISVSSCSRQAPGLLGATHVSSANSGKCGVMGNNHVQHVYGTDKNARGASHQVDCRHGKAKLLEIRINSQGDLSSVSEQSRHTEYPWRGASPTRDLLIALLIIPAIQLHLKINELNKEGQQSRNMWRSKTRHSSFSACEQS